MNASRNAWGALVCLAVIVSTVLLGCSNSSEAPHAKAALSDAAVLDGIEPVIRLDVTGPAEISANLLATSDSTEPVVLVEVYPQANAFDIRVDTELANGTPAEINIGDPPESERSVNFKAPNGSTLSVRSFQQSVDQLLMLADELRLNGNDLKLSGSDWKILTTVPLPGYRSNSHTTEYDLGGDGGVFLSVYRPLGDVEKLFNYSPTAVEIDISGASALQFGAVNNERGFLLDIGDGYVVEVREFTRPGVLSNDDVRLIAESVRVIDAPK